MKIQGKNSKFLNENLNEENCTWQPKTEKVITKNKTSETPKKVINFLCLCIAYNFFISLPKKKTLFENDLKY